MGFAPDGLARKPQPIPQADIEIPPPPEHVTTTQPGSSVPEVNVNLSNLPSQGKPYPEGSVIKYRPYTFGEIKIINGSKMSIIDGYEFILRGIATSFDKYELSASDLLYLGFLRKISSLGTSKFKFSYECGKCRNLNTETLSLDMIEFTDLSVPKLPVTVDLSIGQYKFDVLRVGRFFHLLKGDDQSTLMALAYSCLSHEPEIVKAAVENCTLFDSEKLERLDSYLEHGIKPMTFTCQQEVPVKRSKTQRKEPCQFENTVQVEGGDNLVQPFRESEESIESGFQFG